VVSSSSGTRFGSDQCRAAGPLRRRAPGLVRSETRLIRPLEDLGDCASSSSVVRRVDARKPFSSKKETRHRRRRVHVEVGHHSGRDHRAPREFAAPPPRTAGCRAARQLVMYECGNRPPGRGSITYDVRSSRRALRDAPRARLPGFSTFSQLPRHGVGLVVASRALLAGGEELAPILDRDRRRRARTFSGRGPCHR